MGFRNSNEPNGNSIHLDISKWNSLVKGNTQSGDYISLLNIPGSTSTGTYELANFNARDDADNSTYLHRPTTSTYIGGGYGDDGTWQQGTYTYQLGEWSNEDLEALSSLGINPDNLTFTVTGEASGNPNTDLDLTKLRKHQLEQIWIR